MIHRDDLESLRRILGIEPPQFVLHECDLRSRMYHRVGSGPLGPLAMVALLRDLKIATQLAPERKVDATNWLNVRVDGSVRVEALIGEGESEAVRAGIFMGTMGARGSLAVRLDGENVIREFPVFKVNLKKDPGPYVSIEQPFAGAAAPLAVAAEASPAPDPPAEIPCYDGLDVVGLNIFHEAIPLADTVPALRIAPGTEREPETITQTTQESGSVEKTDTDPACEAACPDTVSPEPTPDPIPAPIPITPVRVQSPGQFSWVDAAVGDPVWVDDAGDVRDGTFHGLFGAHSVNVVVAGENQPRPFHVNKVTYAKEG